MCQRFQPLLGPGSSLRSVLLEPSRGPLPVRRAVLASGLPALQFFHPFHQFFHQGRESILCVDGRNSSILIYLHT